MRNAVAQAATDWNLENKFMSEKSHAGKGSRGIASINPATGEVIRQYEADSGPELERKLELARQTFERYRKTSFSDRALWLTRAAELLEAEKNELGRTMTLEMGKPFQAAVAEAEKCATACRFYAANAERFLADESIDTSGRRCFVRYQPLGPVLAVMPWNFPFWQVFRFAAPALMAGNVGLLKHASNVPQCALAIEQIFLRAGFPSGTFQTLLIGSARTEQVILDPRVAAATLTGSVGAGRSVAAAAGKQVKKTVLELGGSDPFIVMPSANLDQAAAIAVQARTVNNGQSCIAAKRFIVDRKVAADFEQRFVQRMAALKVGDPMDPEVNIGPIATLEVLRGLEQQVEATVRLGACILLGGGRLERKGFFFAPTVLTDIPPTSPASQDELFGPVASLFQVNGIDEALRLANDTPFGLGASIWTNDETERDFFIEEIQSGLAFVNEMVASDPRLPFGGIKQSGYGRELSHHGILEFVNAKTVVINQAGPRLSRTE